MKKLSKKYIKSLVCEAIGEKAESSRKISKSRVKEIIQEEIARHYGAK